jgi:hypothetical protein
MKQGRDWLISNIQAVQAVRAEAPLNEGPTAPGGLRMNRYRIVRFKALALVVAGALLLGVPACVTTPRTINVAKLGRANRIEVYENGKPVLDRVVAAGSAPDRAVTS